MHVADKVFLYAPSAIEVQVEVRHGGLDVVVSEAVFDLGDVSAPESLRDTFYRSDRCRGGSGPPPAG